MTIHERIKSFCQERNIPINKMEQDLGFARGYISKLDKSAPSGEKLDKIAKYLGVTLDYLVNGETKSSNPECIKPMYFSFARELQDKKVTDDDIDKIRRFMDLMDRK